MLKSIWVAGSQYLSRSENHEKEFNIVNKVLTGEFIKWDIVANAKLESSHKKKLMWKKIRKYTKTFSWLRIIFSGFFLYITRTIHRFPIFEFVSFDILFGRPMSYDVMSLWKIFSILCTLGQISFRANVRFSIFFGHLTFRRYVQSTKCLSVRCPFGHMSFGHLSNHLGYWLRV